MEVRLVSWGEVTEEDRVDSWLQSGHNVVNLAAEMQAKDWEESLGKTGPQGLSWWVKNPSANAGDAGSISGPWRFHMLPSN